MSEVRALIEQLVAAGVDPVDAAEVITRAAIAGAQGASSPRSAGAIRQERYRRNKASQSVTGDANVTQDEKKSPPAPPKENNPPSPPKGGTSPKNPRAELERVLPPDSAQDVIEHRQRLRKPLTTKAAMLLARKLDLFADPVAAADVMIERGWQTIEPTYAGAPPLKARSSPQALQGVEYVDRYADETLFQACEKVLGKPVATGIQRYAFPTEVVEKARASA